MFYFFFFSFFFFNYIFANLCYYSNGIGPLAGNCEGPIQRIEAKRKDFSNINHGCSIDQMFFNSGNNQIKCGNCIPGSNGNWRVNGTPSIFSHLVVKYLESTPQNIIKTKIASITATSPSVFCKLNQYCSESAECVDLKDHPLYNHFCDPNIQDSCGFEGLQCIDSKCKICKTIRSHFNDLIVRNQAMQTVWCVAGRYTTNKWIIMFQDPQKFFFFLLGLIYIYFLLKWIGFWKWIKTKIQNRKKRKNGYFQLRTPSF
ncbi:hypothetical protein M0811_02770 [Anaeramoeba ignava]|uniref:Uncharacterized protein n=1 Tax=Anaeramoeba ignava TaxID=1746090 RepID=A0A9Q0L745_ANAIG|nr:hypothetical protein M0811_02770 [Anaeramoeba ignava]